MKEYIKQIVYHPLFSGSMIMVIGSNAVSFINYLYHFVMGRMLGPGDYGELASIISMIGLLGVLPSSITLVITKQISSAKNDKEINSLLAWFKTKIFLASLIYTFFILILSPIMTSFLKIQNTSYFLLIAFSFLFSLQSLLNRSILQGLLKFKEMVSSILAESSAKLLISIILVYLGLKVGGVILALAVSSLLGLYTTYYFLKLKKNLTTNADRSVDIKSMLIFAVPVALQSLASTSIYSSDVILVKHFFSTYEAGIYAALSTLGKIIFFGAGPIGAVMFPLISQRNARGEGYRKIFLYSFFATIMLSIGIMAVYWLYPQLAIRLLYGTAYLEAADLLIWFGIFISLFTLSSLLINYNLSLGKTSIVIIPLIAAFAQIIMIWFLHDSLLTVIFISIIINALLLVSLLIYSTYGKFTPFRR
ncbi:oligosaccharide flippase family protein [Candidatus Daviesbacteria bacterium]|nr:oligosaccharide flippase family protein [Candidatus Daviesbacteria bacterium]